MNKSIELYDYDTGMDICQESRPFLWIKVMLLYAKIVRPLKTSFQSSEEEIIYKYIERDRKRKYIVFFSPEMH